MPRGVLLSTAWGLELLGLLRYFFVFFLDVFCFSYIFLVMKSLKVYCSFFFFLGGGVVEVHVCTVLYGYIVLDLFVHTFKGLVLEIS